MVVSEAQLVTVDCAGGVLRGRRWAGVSRVRRGARQRGVFARPAGLHGRATRQDGGQGGRHRTRGQEQRARDLHHGGLQAGGDPSPSISTNVIFIHS